MSVRGLTVRSLNGGGDEKTGRERVVRSSIGERIGDVKVKCIHNTSISGRCDNICIGRWFREHVEVVISLCPYRLFSQVLSLSLN